MPRNIVSMEKKYLHKNYKKNNVSIFTLLRSHRCNKSVIHSFDKHLSFILFLQGVGQKIAAQLEQNSLFLREAWLT